MTTPTESPTSGRRWLRLSLRGLMVLVLIIGVAAGWVAYRIRTQREAIALARAGGNSIQFDYQRDQVGRNGTRPIYRTEPAAPRWLRAWLGDELFQNVTQVRLTGSVSPEVFAAVARFDRLDFLHLAARGTDGAWLEPLRALGQIRRITIEAPVATDSALQEVAQIASIRELTILWARPVASSPATDAGFVGLAKLANLESLEIHDAPNLTDNGAARMVAGLPRLRQLRLHSGIKSVAQTLPVLAHQHPDLRHLGLDKSGVTDDDLKAIESMTQLEVVHLQGTKITDAGLIHLRPLKNLIHLMVNISGVTDEGVNHLGGLGRLQSLFLGNSKVTDAGLVSLEALGQLKYLSLDRTLVTDSGMASVAKLTNLEELRLNSLPITDAGLPPLQKLVKLKRLDLSGSQVTSAGIAALRLARPQLVVTKQPPRRPPTRSAPPEMTPSPK